MIPDKLTADNSENYKVSIRLMPDGLSFWGYVPSEKDSFFMETFPFDDGMSMVESLKDIIFKYPCFSFVYRSFHVICVSRKYTLAADHIFIETEKDRLFNFCHPADPTLKVLVQPLKSLNAYILFGLDCDVYAFLVRSLTNPHFIHSLSPLMIAWQNKSLRVFPKLMHVVVHPHTMDVMCFEQGNLLFANAYDHENSKDIVYYIMYICKQSGINQLEDYLTISGPQDLCRTVLSFINKYVKKTNYLHQQINDYQVESAHELTLDMIALMECGL